MAEGIVAGTAEEDVRRPGAAAPAARGKGASLTEAPQPDRSLGLLSREIRRNIAERALANISPDIVGTRQRWATLHIAVCFNSERRHTGPAARPDVATVGAIPERFCQRPEVADIVSWEKCDAVRVEPLSFDDGQQRKKIEQVIRLKHELGMIRGPAHRCGQDHHPAARPDVHQEIGDPRKLRHCEAVHLRIDGEVDPTPTDPPGSRDRRSPGTRGPADRVMGLLEPIDRERDLSDPGRGRSPNPFVGHLPRASDDAAEHAVTHDFSRDQIPIVAHVELAADQCDFPEAEISELVDQVERFRGAQFVPARTACARTAMAASEVASQRNLPDRDARRGILQRPPASQALRIAVIEPIGMIADRHRSGRPAAGRRPIDDNRRARLCSSGRGRWASRRTSSPQPVGKKTIELRLRQSVGQIVWRRIDTVFAENAARVLREAFTQHCILPNPANESRHGQRLGTRRDLGAGLFGARKRRHALQHREQPDNKFE